MWKDFCIAIGNPNRYDQLLKHKNGRVVAYVLVLVLLSGILSFGVPVGIFVRYFSGQFSEEFPEFSLSKAGFVVEQTIEYDQKPVLLRATNRELLTADGLEEYISAILFDAEKAIIKNGTDILQFRFSDLEEDFLFEKKDLPKLKPFFLFALGFAAILFCIVSAISLLFYSVVIAAIGRRMNAGQKVKLQFSQLFRLALYTRAFPILFGAVLGLFGIYFSPIVGGVVSCVILWFALKHMNADESETPIEE